MLLLSVSVSTLYAQQGRQQYDEAMLYFEKGRYDDALRMISAAEQSIGRITPKTESLKAMCYREKNDVIAAKIAVSNYLKMAPASGTGGEMHKYMQELNLELSDLLEKEEKKFKEKEKDLRMQEVDRIIQVQSNQTAQQYAALKSRNEDRLFEIFRNSTDVDEMKIFTDVYQKTSGRARQVAERQQYFQLVADGDRSVSGERYSAGVRYYQDAMKINSPDSLQRRLLRALDLEAFAKARESRSIDDYWAYVSKYPEGIYIEAAANTIVSFYVERTEEEITEKDYYNLFDHLDKAAPILPKATATTKKKYYVAQLKAARLMEANTKIMKNNQSEFTSVQNAYKSYYDNYEKDPAVAQQIGSLKRKYKRWHSHDNGFGIIAWRMDKQNMIGGDVLGYFSHSSLGFVLSFRTNADINRTSQTMPIPVKKYREENYTHSFVSVNFTYKVFHPVWLYVGGGVAGFAKVEQLPDLSGMNGELKPYITSSVKVMPSAETGVYISLKPFIISAGATIPFMSQNQKDLFGIDKQLIIPTGAIGLRYGF